MTKHRPFGITLLAIFVGIAAVVAVFHTLQFLHLMPFFLGPISFFAFDLLGALLWGLNSLILIWVTSSLWNLRQEGRLFILVIAILNLILAIMSVLGQSTLQAMLPAILINLIILIYCLLPNVDAAFKEVKQPAPAAAAPMAAAPAARAAAVPPPAPVVSAPVVEAPVAAVSAAAVMAVASTEEEAVVEEPAPMEPEVAAAVVMEEALAEPEAVAPVMEEVVAEPEAAAVEAEAGEANGPVPPPAPRAKVPIETIEGIGPTYGAKLKEIGILVVADLLTSGASRRGREELVEKTGISAALILKWVNMADLMRISGIGEEYSELLEAAGVDTVKELRNRVPENLYQAMLNANSQRQLVRRTPHLSEVQSWVEQAKTLDPIMSY